jgi:hypothetical protein
MRLRFWRRQNPTIGIVLKRELQQYKVPAKRQAVIAGHLTAYTEQVIREQLTERSRVVVFLPVTPTTPPRNRCYIADGWCERREFKNYRALVVWLKGHGR